jgi:hypothetical protein
VTSQKTFAKVAKIDVSIDGVYYKSKDACLRELCRQPFWRYDYDKLTIHRALRAMYCEHGIAKMLQKQFHTTTRIVVIALSADVMLSKPLQEADILSAACSRGKVFLTQNNDGLDGYTNGFYVYMGHIDTIKDVLSTFEHLPSHLHSSLCEHVSLCYHVSW